MLHYYQVHYRINSFRRWEQLVAEDIEQAIILFKTKLTNDGFELSRITILSVTNVD